MESGRIFNIQRFSLHDGPGIRTTVFFKGCPAHCLWCHNPESQSFAPQIIVLSGRCIRCGACGLACPWGLLTMAPTGSPISDERCQACERCSKACPADARQLAGREMTVSEVMAEVHKDLVFYDTSGGGVTFSGGEPLAQPEFLQELLIACKTAGIHTAVDTCGFAPTDLVHSLAPLVDLFLFDLKLMDDADHRAQTGLPLSLILENLKELGAIHKNIWVRVPVVPGYTDETRNLEAIAAFASTIAGVRRVNLLPYHPTGAQKFARLNREYPLRDVKSPLQTEMLSYCEIFRAHGLNVHIGG